MLQNGRGKLIKFKLKEPCLLRTLGTNETRLVNLKQCQLYNILTVNVLVTQELIKPNCNF